jgi:hypothetical protein
MPSKIAVRKIGWRRGSAWVEKGIDLSLRMVNVG